MPSENAETTADVLTYADLHGVDTHGMSLLTVYDERRREGKLNLNAKPRVERETAVSVLVDGDGGLGHAPTKLATSMSIAKAKEIGVGLAGVHNSAHFGACGYYTKMIADEGLIGFVTTSASQKKILPTRGKQPRLGTDPLSFAAPAADGRDFILDMATTTVAGSRVRNKLNENQPCPIGWVLDAEGRPSTDPRDLLERDGFMTSLGGTEEGASYKGYGLGVMVNILSSCLTGATLITDPMHTKKPQGMDIGHFVMAIDPGLFRDQSAFEADVATLLNDMRGAEPVDQGNPVLVAGDLERASAHLRSTQGIPIAPGLRRRIMKLAETAGVPWKLATD